MNNTINNNILEYFEHREFGCVHEIAKFIGNDNLMKVGARLSQMWKEKRLGRTQEKSTCNENRAMKHTHYFRMKKKPVKEVKEPNNIGRPRKNKPMELMMRMLENENRFLRKELGI